MKDDSWGYRCIECQQYYPSSYTIPVCACGGVLDAEFDVKPLDVGQLSTEHTRSLWNFKSLLVPIDGEVIQGATMSEGFTPLIRLRDNLFGKAEFMMPTLSFKDRGASVLVAAMKSMDIRRCHIDSSGNAAISIAAYCARVGIICDVFVPASTSRMKLFQLEMYKAHIHTVEGSREESAKAAWNHMLDTGSFYASHVYNPLFHQGMKTYLYELFVQLRNALPDMLVIPVGNGTLFLGIYHALKEFLKWKFIDKIPKVIAVQASACAPLAMAGEQIRDDVSISSSAEGIAIAKPPRASQIRHAMDELFGTWVVVSDEEIDVAWKELASKGVFVEPTSAATYAGYNQYVHAYCDFGPLQAVIPLCSAGLKTTPKKI